MINPNIFKAYDIRGIYPEDLNEDAAYAIGRGYAMFIKKDSKKDKIKFVVGHDNRNSSDSLFKELVKGITDEGADVIDIDLTTTPMLYFSVIDNQCDGGINVTASHNPKQYNGFKLVKEGALSLSESVGLNEIKEIALKGAFDKPITAGKVIKKNMKDIYVNKNVSPEKFDIKVIVDTANSVSGIVVDKMLKNTKLKHIFSELDGNFPNHEPDPLKSEKNTEALRKGLVEGGFDVGISFDGDGDRMFLTDEKGNVIPSDLVLALASSVILRTNKGAKILYDVRCSKIVKETIESLGGEGVISRVGHSFIRDTMREEDILLGGEFSGHYYAKQGNYYFEAPYLVIFLVLNEMKDTGKPLSKLILPFRKYFHSGEINFSMENKQEIIDRIKNKYANGKLLDIDGIRFDFPDWWFSLRPSNTEPLLRLIIEAKTKELMEEKIAEFTKDIKS